MPVFWSAAGQTNAHQEVADWGFPCWERDIPTLGTWHSHVGNKVFPRWEYRAWISITSTYQPIRNAYCSIRDAYCGIRNRLKNPMAPFFMSLVCHLYVVFMSFLCHLLILQSSGIELNTTNLCHMSLVFVISQNDSS